ncbi:MAG: hypothetical protein NT124_00320 [Candidatus Dependentiae bacterium]|nr:hypothetical protein [Candidatus Dependentiae bacterium]
MIDNGDFFNKNHSGQFTISYELLCLLRWIVEHDTNGLKNIVTTAMRDGLHTELQKIDTISDLNLTASGIEETVSDFAKILELLLLDAMDEEMVRKAEQKKLMTDINKIDVTLCDDDTVRISLEKTTTKIEHNPKVNPKEQLYKEILKQWQPQNKKLFN